MVTAWQFCCGCSTAQLHTSTRSAVIPVDRKEKWWHQRYQRNVSAKKAQMEKTKLIFLGDSITEGMYVARDSMEKNWGAFHPQEFGIGGDGTEHLLWRLRNGEVDGLNPNVAVVLIGTNNLGDNNSNEIYSGVQAVVQELRKRLPDTKVLVLGLLPRGATSDDPLRIRAKAVNDILSTGIADGKSVFYTDAEKALLQPDGKLSEEVMPDYLHPSAKGYDVLFTAIKPTVDKLLKN